MPQEGETEEDFAQRKVDVTNYLRQYGSNFYSGKDLDDFISRTTSNLGYAQGGRVGFAAGSGGYESFKDFIEDTGDEEIMDVYIDVLKGIQPEEALFKLLRKKGYQTYAQGGRVEVMGGGIMGLGKIPMGTPRMNQGGVTELDYRAEGGFVPVGIKEKADDVPAMLSKNEFVMTADAVRAAGNGSIEKGAQKMYDTMKQLESRVV